MAVPRLITFLRAINVGGHTVTMAALRDHFAALGFEDVETFIASGNVIARSRTGSTQALERRIEAHLLATQSGSTITNVQFERLVKARTTFRGMNTVVRLVAKYGLE
jgi:uncharacterized protein (DUF1697 family)